MKNVLKIVIMLGIILSTGTVNAALYGPDFSVFGGSKEDVFFNIYSSSDGGYLLTGFTQSIDGDFKDYYAGNMLVKVDSNGKKQWVKNGTYSQIVPTSDGAYLGLKTFVHTIEKFSKNGEVIWTCNIDSLRIIVLNDGGFMGINENKIERFDGEGTKIDEINLNVDHSYMGLYKVSIAGFSINKDGNFVVLYQGSKNEYDQNDISIGESQSLFVEIIDIDGNLVKQMKLFGGYKHSYGLGISSSNDNLDANGNIYYFEFKNNTGYIGRITSSMGTDWKKQIGADGNWKIIDSSLYVLSKNKVSVYDLDGKLIRSRKVDIYPLDILALENSSYVLAGVSNNSGKFKGYTYQSWDIENAAISFEKINLLANSPTIGTVQSDADGFKTSISNYDSLFKYIVTTTRGTVSISKTGLIAVSKLLPGESAEVTISTSRTGYDEGSSKVSGTSLIGVGLTPKFGSVTKTTSGFTAQITNYSNQFKWSVSTSSGKVSINKAGLITVTGLTKGKSATVTVSTTRTGYNSGNSKVTGSSK